MTSEEAREVYLVGASSWYWTGEEAASAQFGFGCSKEDAEIKLSKSEPTAEQESAVEVPAPAAPAAPAAAAAAERQVTQSHH